MNDEIEGNGSSASGFIVDGYEGVSGEFTHLTCVHSSREHVLTRAQRHGRWYLLKSLAPEVAEKAVFQEMLAKEFDIAMRVQHPGIVQTVNLEEVPSLGRCIVMEWIDGLSLKQWLEKSSSRAERRRAFNQLLDAVSYLHDLGIVHRDLKPANILITSNGDNVKLIDFSLADTDVYAVLKQPAGTEGYISPEQANVAKPDVRNDIYSLGVIMQQMDLGRTCNYIGEKCLLPTDKRYQSIAELKAALKSSKALALWILIALIVVILTILLSVMFALWHHSTPVSITEEVTVNDTVSNPVGVEPETVFRVDSILDKTKDAEPNVAVSESIPVRSIEDSMKSTPPATEPKPDQGGHVGNAVSDGSDELNFALYKYVAQHRQDTLTDVKYLELDYADMKRFGHSEIEKYINKIQGQFSDKELEYIRGVLVRQCDGYVDWIDELVRSRWND